MKMTSRRKVRLLYLAAAIAILAMEIVIALYIRDAFVRPYLGDVLAVMLVYCTVRAMWKRVPERLALYVFLFAVAVELSQLFGLAAWLGVSGGSFGVLLGGAFDWADIGMYLVGCALMLGVQALEVRTQNKTEEREKQK